MRSNKHAERDRRAALHAERDRIVAARSLGRGRVADEMRLAEVEDDLEFLSTLIFFDPFDRPRDPHAT